MAELELHYYKGQLPVYIRTPEGLDLRDYQVEGVRFLLARKKAILGDQVRLGKTIQAYAALQGIREIRARELGWDIEETALDILVLCKKSALHVWEDEAEKWGFEPPTIVHGSGKNRDILWQDNFVVSTYETFKFDYNKAATNRVWDAVICDEPHKKIKNRKTQNFKAVRGLSTRYMFFLTGTPMPKGPQDLFTYLNLINRTKFSSYWKHVNTFCETIDGMYGKEIVGVRNVEAFQKVLSQYMIRRTKKDVGAQITEPIRDIVPLVSDECQKKQYEDFALEMMHVLSDGGIDVVPFEMVRNMKYRQIMVSPKLIDPSCKTYGAGIEYIVDWLDDADDRDKHIVIFSPFPSVFPFIRERLEKEGYEDIFELRGGISHTKTRDQIKGFDDTGGIMMCSTLFAQGFDLSSSEFAFMLGYEWTPDDNRQAEGRLESFDMEIPPTFYYLSHQDVGGDIVLEALVNRSKPINEVLRSEKFLHKVFNERFAQELLESNGSPNVSS